MGVQTYQVIPVVCGTLILHSRAGKKGKASAYHNEHLFFAPESAARYSKNLFLNLGNEVKNMWENVVLG